MTMTLLQCDDKKIMVRIEIHSFYNVTILDIILLLALVTCKCTCCTETLLLPGWLWGVTSPD